MATSVVQVCQITPPPGGRPEQTLPLQYYDIVRLPYHLLNLSLFFKIPCSRSHFLNTFVPSLKKSFSLTLKHFLPLAGNIVVPLSSSARDMPYIRYVAGDSLPLTVAVSDADFDHLTGNHPRDSDLFHDFAPLVLPHSYYSSDDSFAFSPVAFQLTLLPGQGICLSQTLNHALFDGRMVLAFAQAWASVDKLNSDAHLHGNFTLSYDRSGTAADKDLATRAWNYANKYSPTTSLTIPLPTNKVRATFFISYADVQTLKTIALNKKPGMACMASQTVLLSAYIWSCLAKAAEIAGEAVSDNEAEYLTCTADIRGRMNPPLPLDYFGNCTVLVLAETTHGTLKGKDGFMSAVVAIGEAILNNKKENVVDDLDIRVKVKSGNKRVVTIAGSPQFEIYDLDFGFGKPYKFEYPTNDCDESVFLCRPKGGGGIEIVMSMSKVKMDAFAVLFHQGLNLGEHNCLYPITF